MKPRCEIVVIGKGEVSLEDGIEFGADAEPLEAVGVPGSRKEMSEGVLELREAWPEGNCGEPPREKMVESGLALVPPCHNYSTYVMPIWAVLGHGTAMSQLLPLWKAWGGEATPTVGHGPAGTQCIEAWPDELRARPCAGTRVNPGA